MDIDIETLVRYPMESDDWLVTVLIGGGALLFAFLVVPWFLVMGYLVRGLRAGMERAEEPPGFDDWGTMLEEGLVAAVITVAYQLVPLVVFVVFVGGSLLALLSGSDAGGVGGLLGLVVGAFVSWVLSLVFGYVGLAGVINYADEGNLGAGFDFGVIADVATDRTYLVAWVYVIALQIVVGMVVGLLNIIPFLGAIVGVFVSFYALIIAAWLLGAGFAESLGRGAAAGEDSGASGSEVRVAEGAGEPDESGAVP